MFKRWCEQGIKKKFITKPVLYVLDLREQIRNDAIKQLQVILQELWNVNVTDGSKNNQLLFREKA